MKSFNQFMNEADIRKNPAVSPEYLSSLDKRGEANAQELERKHGMGMGKLMTAVREVQSIQRGHEKEIEDLTYKVVMEKYGEILGETQLDIKIPRDPREIQNMMSSSKNQDQHNYTEIEDEATKTAINKRKILNMIAQGEAINSRLLLMSDSNFDGLREIFGEEKARRMVDLLVTITDICSARDWRIPEEVGAAMIENGGAISGASKIEWDNSGDSDDSEEGDNEEQSDSATIIIRGIDQATLFHEAVKGIYGLINQGGLAHLDDATIQKVFMNTDTPRDEVQDLKRAKLTAADLRDFINTFPESESIPNFREYVWGKMVDAQVLSDQAFLGLMKHIFDASPLYRNPAANEPSYTEAEKEAAKDSMTRARIIVGKLINLIKSELEEWESGEEDDDYREFTATLPDRDESQLSQAEINKRIDAALDAMDFEEVRRLSQYLNE